MPIDMKKEIEFITITRKEINLPLIVGIDEAGRGPVLGPMVVACVAAPKDSQIDKAFMELGIKDSKLLTREKREKLFEKIVELLALVSAAYIPPHIIDEWVYRRKYNYLEAKIISMFLTSIPNIEVAYIDAPSSSEDFRKKVLHYLDREPLPQLIIEKQADKKYPIVSAASIIAKVLRDRAIEDLKKDIGIDFGSGYPSDPKTREALPLILRVKPEIIRRSWRTLRKTQQAKLDIFINEKKTGDKAPN